MKSRKRIGCWFLVAKNRTRIGCWSWCGWKKICTIWDRWYSRWNLCTNGRFSISSAWLDFFHQQFQFGLVDPGCNAARCCQTKMLKGPIRNLAMRMSRKESQCFVPLMDKIYQNLGCMKDWTSWDKLLNKWLGQDFVCQQFQSIWELCKIVLLTAIPCHTIDPCVFDLGVFSTRCEDAIEHLLEYAKCKLLQMWEDPGWITCDHAIYLQCFIWGKFLSGPVNQKIWWWGGIYKNHSLWGRFTSSNQKSCCLRNGPTKWQDTLTGNIDAKAMAKVGKGTLIYWMHWIQLNSLNTLCSSWVFFASFQSCDHPQILKETLPLAALRPDILKISAALAAIDHRLANLGRYHRGWP